MPDEVEVAAPTDLAQVATRDSEEPAAAAATQESEHGVAPAVDNAGRAVDEAPRPNLTEDVSHPGSAAYLAPAIAAEGSAEVGQAETAGLPPPPAGAEEDAQAARAAVVDNAVEPPDDAGKPGEEPEQKGNEIGSANLGTGYRADEEGTRAAGDPAESVAAEDTGGGGGGGGGKVS
mmetsp:Transcript_34213/g.96985  ORF Transcript_34213/g.96985 Transcript_34213/m.96985 type:complete len:176 (-) Transcript_34213:2436-2963(-)